MTTNVLLAEVAAAASGPEELVLRLLLQLAVILAASRIVSWLARRFLGQTDVSGEILAGLLLGPSFLGAISKTFMEQLFHPSTREIFGGIAEVGLVLLLFQIGLEFEFKEHLGRDRRPVLAISLVGLALPFACGYLAAPWFWGQFAEPRPSLEGFRLFFAVALSITALPVLGRIYMELGLSHTRTAALTVGAAAINDAAGWLILGVVAVVVRGDAAGRWILPRLAGLAAYAAVLWFVARPLLKHLVSRHLDRHGTLRAPAIGAILVLVFASAAATSALGIFAIIGGFALGLTLHDDRRFATDWKLRVSPLVWTLFLPIFFACTGLRTDIGSLHGPSAIVQCLLVCGLAFATKFIGAFAAARACGEDLRSATTIGVSMNTRGLMELIALNIGYQLGVLPRPMYTILVLMALASTLLATPAIRYLMKREQKKDGDPLSGPAAESRPVETAVP
ncbi:MAG: cation:proton antiporter [Planctomycetota bacterium]